MKRIFFLILVTIGLSAAAYGANQTLADKTATTTAPDTALMYLLLDPTGSPLDRKIAVSDFIGSTVGQSVTSPIIYGSAAENGDITIHGTSNATKTTSYMILQPTGGNVGIGTTAPGARLEVLSTTFPVGREIRSVAASGTSFLGVNSVQARTAGDMNNGFGAGMGFEIRDVAGVDNAIGYIGAVRNGADNTGDLVFYPISAGSASEKMRITSTGNVGIGTASPSQQLEITGDFEIPNTTFADQSGIIYKGTTPFIHNFNYGNNGTVTTEGSNTFVGLNAGNLTMGSTATETYHSSYNSFIGASAGQANTTGSYNSFIGRSAGQANTTGSTNVFLGSSAGYSNTTGYSNSFLGSYAGYSNTTGYGNSFLGRYAGRYIADGATPNTTSGNCVLIGNDTKVLAYNDQNSIVIGYNAIGLGSNTAVLGNDSITKTALKGTVCVGATSPIGAEKLSVTGDVYVTADVSALTFTDRTPMFEGDALTAIKNIKAKDGQIDHSTLPTFVQVDRQHISKEVVLGPKVYIDIKDAFDTVEEAQEFPVMEDVEEEYMADVEEEYEAPAEDPNQPDEIKTRIVKEPKTRIVQKQKMGEPIIKYSIEDGKRVQYEIKNPLTEKIKVSKKVLKPGVKFDENTGELYNQTETVNEVVTTVPERDLGASISVNVVAIQQLLARIEAAEAKIAALEKR